MCMAFYIVAAFKAVQKAGKMLESFGKGCGGGKGEGLRCHGG